MVEKSHHDFSKHGNFASHAGGQGDVDGDSHPHGPPGGFLGNLPAHLKCPNNLPNQLTHKQNITHHMLKVAGNFKENIFVATGECVGIWMCRHLHSGAEGLTLPHPQHTHITTTPTHIKHSTYFPTQDEVTHFGLVVHVLACSNHLKQCKKLEHMKNQC